MNTTNKILLALLALQAVLVAVTWASDLGRAGAVDTRTLFDIEASQVTAFEVSTRAEAGEAGEPGEPAKTVRLVRKGEGFVVDGADDFPADAKKVDEVLGKLLGASHRDPIAEHVESHNALSVGDATYAKKVVVSIGDTKRTLLVGNAKGTSVHARFEGEPTVYLARGISAWGLADQVESYIDAAYVEIEDPTEVQVQNSHGVIDLRKDEQGKWQVAQLRPGSAVDESRVRAFVSAARAVRTVEPVGKTVDPAYGLGAGAVMVRLKAGDKTAEYAIGAEVGEHRYVKAASSEYVVKVRKFAVETLIKQTPEQFVEEPRGVGPGGMPGGMPGMPGGMPGMPGGIPGGMPGEMRMPPPGEPMMPPPGQGAEHDHAGHDHGPGEGH